MKKKIVCKILIISIMASMMISSFAGCKTSETEGTGENISEVVSEEVSEAPSDEVASDEVMGSEETSEETSSEAFEEATEETTEKTTEETSSEKTSEEKSEEESEEESSEPEFTVEHFEMTMYAQKNVNVRMGPSTDYEKVGGLSINQEVKVTGKANGWYRIVFKHAKSEEGFVSMNYLGEGKVVVEVPPEHKKPEQPPSEQPPSEQPQPSEQPPSEQPPSEQPPSQEEFQVRVDYDMLALINQERAACGASQLVWNSSVEAAAMARVKAIAESGQLSHDNPLDGTRGEIMLKRKSGNLSDMIEQYKGSPGHYGVMTTDGFSSMVSVSCGVWSELGQRINMYYNVVIFF